MLRIEPSKKLIFFVDENKNFIEHGVFDEI